MANSIPKRCRERGCGTPTTHRHGYCDQHASLASWGKYQQQSARFGKRVYQTAHWRNVIVPRVKEIAGCLCLNCLLARPSIVKQGKITEHIIPASKGGDESDQNLSFFCEDCAKEKTAWERNKSPREIQSRYAHTSIFLALQRAAQG
jgi:5-methylcytosine-specific restriction protein A